MAGFCCWRARRFRERGESIGATAWAEGAGWEGEGTTGLLRERAGTGTRGETGRGEAGRWGMLRCGEVLGEGRGDFLGETGKVREWEKKRREGQKGARGDLWRGRRWTSCLSGSEMKRQTRTKILLDQYSEKRARREQNAEEKAGEGTDHLRTNFPHCRNPLQTSSQT